MSLKIGMRRPRPIEFSLASGQWRRGRLTLSEF